MADYTKTTDFATKDGLPSGNPDKLVKGTEIDVEFNAIETASATKANSSNPATTGTHTHTGDTTVTGTLTAGIIEGGTY
jgi:hypothetical protein